MHNIPIKINDILQWLLITATAALSFVIENGDDIVKLCAVAAALLQVFIQIKRARKSD